jgi:hypothetical protein
MPPSPISDEDFKYLHKKYDKLFFKIAHYIHGDECKDVNDFNQEIWIFVLNFFPRYLEKTGLTLQEFCEHPEYSKYVKQWAWTYKNSIGQKITNKNKLMGTQVRLDAKDANSEELYDASYSSPLTYNDSPICNIELEELKNPKTDKDLVLSKIAFGEDTIMKNGVINQAELSRQTRLSPIQVSRIIKEIKQDYKNAIKNS